MKETSYAENIYWVYGITIESPNYNSKELREELRKNNIGTRPFFYPLHKQPVLKKYPQVFRPHEVLPNAEKIWLKGLYLPSGISLKNEQIEYVSNTLKNILNS